MDRHADDMLDSVEYLRATWSQEAALTHIREQSGSYFDPQVVDLFFRVIESQEAPPATAYQKRLWNLRRLNLSY